MREVDEALAGLPAPPSENQVVIVDRLIADFDNEMSKQLTSAGFQGDLLTILGAFSKTLKETRPQIKFHLTRAAEKEELEAWRAQAQRTRADGSWFDERAPPPAAARDDTPTPGYVQGEGGVPEDVRTLQRAVPSTPTGRKRAHAGDAAPGSLQKRLRQAGCGSGSGGPISHGPISHGPHHKYTLPRIRYIIESTSTAGLPNQIHPTAVENVAKDSFKEWEGHLHRFIDRVRDCLHRQFRIVFSARFRRYEKSPIFQKARPLRPLSPTL